jgi:hypothetical protein
MMQEWLFLLQLNTFFMLLKFYKKFAYSFSAFRQSLLFSIQTYHDKPTIHNCFLGCHQQVLVKPAIIFKREEGICKKCNKTIIFEDEVALFAKQ